MTTQDGQDLIRLLEKAGNHRRVGLAEPEIAALAHDLGIKLPLDYRAFLSWSGGWEGRFGERWLVLDHPRGVRLANNDAFRELFPGYVAIGGDGALETFAFRCEPRAFPTALVAIDRNSSDPEDIWPMASSLTESLELLLRIPNGPWQSKTMSEE